MNDNSSGIGFIIILLLLVALLYFFWKFLWWIIAGGAILIILFIVLLVLSSKKSKGSENEIETQVREALSKIRQQKFKAENKITRMLEWANSAIYTTYSDLFGAEYSKPQLLENYEEIKQKYGDQIPATQLEKTDNIVNAYKQHIEIEKVKIENLEKLQKEYEELKEQIKIAKAQEKTNKQLDSHIKRLKESEMDTSAEENIIKSRYTLEDLTREVQERQIYIEQLEELTDKYGDKITDYQIEEYKKEMDALNNNLD